VAEFALQVEGSGSENRLITMWEDPAPLTDKEFLENLTIKKQLGISVEQVLKEAGYGDNDIKEMLDLSKRLMA
jgi:predicted XRE-type DNA-binding protein